MFDNIKIINRKKHLRPTSHYYIHLRWQQRELAFGRYGLGKSSLVALTQYTDIQHLVQAMKPQIQSRSGILVYIHGFMAHVGFFEKKAGFYLQHDVFDHIQTNYPVVLSLKWESEPDYQQSIQSASQKAELLWGALLTIYRELDGGQMGLQWSWLCHSMGNRIFAHLFVKKQAEAKNMVIKDVLLMAADIPNDIFSKELNGLISSTCRTFCFISKTDKTLEIANWIVPYPRLGREGAVISASSSHLLEVDVSEITDHEGLAPRLLKHRYYYASNTIRKLLVMILNGEDNMKPYSAPYCLRT